MNKTKIIIGSLLIVALIIAGSWAFRYYTAEIRGVVPAEERIQSADFRIFSYEHFFTMLAEINATEAEWDAQYELLPMLTPDTKRYQEVQQNLAAIKAHIERLKRRYNADALMEGTRGQFRATNLPSRVPTEPHEYGNRTGGI